MAAVLQSLLPTLVFGAHVHVHARLLSRVVARVGAMRAYAWAAEHCSSLMRDVYAPHC